MREMLLLTHTRIVADDWSEPVTSTRAAGDASCGVARGELACQPRPSRPLDQLPVTSTLSWGLHASRFYFPLFTMSRWPESKTLKFIRFYKQNRCLWDPSMPEYKNKVLRERACQNMIQQMQAKDCTTVYSIKHKIKNLRSTYHQELKKVKDSLIAGDGTHDKPTLSWFYEMHSFIGSIKSEGRSSTAVESVSNYSYIFLVGRKCRSLLSFSFLGFLDLFLLRTQ